MSYVTYAQVKAFKGDLDADKTLVESLIARAEGWLNRECRRTLVAESDTTRYADAAGDHLDGRYLEVSWLGDLCAVTTLVNGDGTTITSAQYTTYPKPVTFEKPTIQRLKLLDSVNIFWTYTTDWENAIAITGRWALFSSASVPAEITNAVIRLALYLYKVKDTDAFETIVIPEAGIIQAPSGFPADVARLVRLFRKVG